MVKKKSPAMQGSFFESYVIDYGDGGFLRVSLIRENTLPTASPKRTRITITTIDTKTRIKAYSTKP
jgi:hypothetical protein